MEKSQKKKIGGGKLSRTEIVTVRLDPQLRYLIELAARKQRRTVSSFIEWTLEQSLETIVLSESLNLGRRTIADEKLMLWDVDEADRLVKLAFHYPEILNHEEQLIWKLIKESNYLWRKKYNPDWGWWEISERHLIWERLRESWKIFCNVAAGIADKSSLPQDDPIPF